MNPDKLNNVIKEAERFLERAKILQKETRKTSSYLINGKEIVHIPGCPKESGAVRRASMDLTRALAEYRRS